MTSSSLADVASPVECKRRMRPFHREGKTGLKTSVRHIQGWAQWYGAEEVTHQRGKNTWIVFILHWGVCGPLCKGVTTSSLKHEVRVQRRMDSDDGKINNKIKRIQPQALKSLKKAAVAIFSPPPAPRPPKYSQTCVKLRIYCCFTAYNTPKTEVKSFQYDSFSFQSFIEFDCPLPSATRLKVPDSKSPANFLLRTTKKYKKKTRTMQSKKEKN